MPVKIDPQTRALVTGASSGIGRAIAQALGARGAKLALAARRTEALEHLADEIADAGAPRPIVLPGDLSRAGEAERLGAAAREALGGVDLLVNNAGTSIKGRQDEVGDAAAARSLFEINYWSPLALARVLVPEMRARGGGAIANVSSVASIMPMPTYGHYSSTKAALSLATEALRLELRGSGVDVLHVMPGPVDTPLLSRAKTDVKDAARLLERTPEGDPDTLARKLVAALEKRRERLIYPGSLAVVQRFPNLALWFTQRFAPSLEVEP
jgi:short-subunit dehydrogenase